MAGYTTGTLVALYEPEAAHVQPPASFTTQFGLAPHVRRLNVFALISSAFLSIAWLVFLNASQVFVLSDLLDVPPERIGSTTGTFILADETVSLLMVFVWGGVADVGGVRWVNVMGHLIVGLAFFCYVNVGTVYPGLLLARMLFAVGGSALVVCLSAVLASFTALPSTPPTRAPTESTSLLPVPEEDDGVYAAPDPKLASRFAGLLGFATGCGALLAVFVFLRLPARIAEWYPTLADTTPNAIQRGLKYTYYLVSLLAVLEGLFLVVGLKLKSSPRTTSESEKVPLGERFKEVAQDLPVGFIVAWNEPEVALAYLSGFATRAQSLVCSAFIPLLVNNFFIRSGLCDTPLIGGEGCRQAFIVASTVTGVIQLVSLLCAGPLGYLASTYSQPLVLSITCSLGAISFIGFAFLPDGDPRQSIVWLWALGIGISQIGGIVVSLALVARTRGEVVAREKREVGGAISGAYSACGGLGVLLVGKIGGTFADSWIGAPFFIVGIVNGITALSSLVIYTRKSREL